VPVHGKAFTGQARTKISMVPEVVPFLD